MENSFPALPCPAGTSTNAAAGIFCPTSYLAVAMKVFNLFVNRWNYDSSTCGGGLRWQFYPGNAGYNYKVSPLTSSSLTRHSP